MNALDQNSPADSVIPKLYLSAEEDPKTPELLFFDEELIRDSSWKKASEKGRQLWLTIKERYERIACEAFAGDRFLRRLHSFRKITIALNRPIDPAEVRIKLKRMLRDRSYHHLRWLIIDLILLPLSLFVAIVPGPNLIGYYLLFRVFSHWRSYRSASAARLDNLDVCVDDQAQEVIALLKKGDLKTGLIQLRQKYGLRALQEQQIIPQSMMRLVRMLRTDSR